MQHLTLTNMHFVSQFVFLCVSCNSDYKHQLITSLRNIHAIFVMQMRCIFCKVGSKFLAFFSFLKRTNGSLMRSSFVGSFALYFKQLATFPQIFLHKYVYPLQDIQTPQLSISHHQSINNNNNNNVEIQWIQRRN